MEIWQTNSSTHRTSPFISWWMAVEFPNIRIRYGNLSEWMNTHPIRIKISSISDICFGDDSWLSRVGQRPIYIAVRNLCAIGCWVLYVIIWEPFWRNEYKSNSNENKYHIARFLLVTTKWPSLVGQRPILYHRLDHIIMLLVICMRLAIELSGRSESLSEGLNTNPNSN